MSDQQQALRTRDALQKMIRSIIQEERPSDRFAVVQAINSTAATATVIYVGESQEHTVKMGAVRPSGIGQRVRIGGAPDDRWIIDVVGQALVSGSTSTDSTGNVSPTWNGLQQVAVGQRLLLKWSVTTADFYEVQVATDVWFGAQPYSEVLASYQTKSTEFLTPDEFPVGEVKVRVRGVLQGAPSNWSTIHAIIIAPPDSQISDGFAPSDSPDVTVSGGIGSIFVEWLPVSNNDTVTYEVYMDLESGFTPAPGNLAATTTSTFYSTSTLPNGSPIPYGTNVFVRVIARDSDGAAPVGAQGYAMARQVDLGDIGNVPLGGLPDGLVPTVSPDIPHTIRTGAGIAFLKWNHITNTDQVTYEVHVSPSQGFTPTASTVSLESTANFAFVKTYGPSEGDALLPLDTAVFARVWAKDADGYAPEPSLEFSFVIPKIGGGEVGLGAIDTENIAFQAIKFALIDTLAVDTANIADGAIQNAQIGELAVERANIKGLAVDTAQINTAAVKNAQIENGAIDRFKLGTGSIESVHINGAIINDAHIQSLNASKITAGYLNANLINGGTINGQTINGGTITGTTITGAYFQTGTSGNLIRISAVPFGSAANLEMLTDYGVGGGIKCYDAPRPGFPASYGDAGVMEIRTPAYNGFYPLIKLVSSSEYGGTINCYAEAVRMPYGTLNQPSLQFGFAQIQGQFPPREGQPAAYQMGWYRDYGSNTITMVANDRIMSQQESGKHIFRFGATWGTTYFTDSLVADSIGLIQYKSGTAWWQSTNNVSDIRLKSNIKHVTEPRLALDVIKATPSITFEFNEDTGFVQGERLGLSAQDLQSVFPQGVTDIDGQLLLDAPSMIALLWRAVAELDSKVKP